MASSYFVAPQRIGEILYEKAEARRQRYANRRDSLGGTSSYRPGTSGSVMTNIFPTRQPRGGKSAKMMVQSGRVAGQSSARPLSAVQSKHFQNAALAFNSDRHVAKDSLQTSRSFGPEAIDLTVRGRKAPCTTDHSKVGASSLRKGDSKELTSYIDPDTPAMAPAAVLPTEPLALQAPDSRESLDRRDSLALSPSLVPYSPAPVPDLPIFPRQEGQSETTVPQQRNKRVQPLKMDATDTSEKECSETTDISFAGSNSNSCSHPDKSSAKAPISRGQDMSHCNTIPVPANSKDCTSTKDRYMRPLYSANLQQQKLPRSRYTQGLLHITSQQKSHFSSKSFLTNGAQSDREMQLDIEAYRQFCKQLVILATEQRKLKQGLTSKVDDQDGYPELNLTHEDMRRLKNMGYNVSTFCKKLLTMSTEELTNIEAEFERELVNLRKNGLLSGERRINHEKIQADLKQLNKDVEIPKMRPNSANSVGLSTSDVRSLVYERQTNMLLKYSPRHYNQTQSHSKTVKTKTQNAAGGRRNIRFDPSLIQYAERKQEEYNRVQSDLYLNKLYIKSLIDEQLAELGSIERIDKSGRLVQSKPLMSIRSVQAMKRLPESMVLSSASITPMEKQSNIPSRIVAAIPQVTDPKAEREISDEVAQLKEVTPSISSESSSECCELRKTFRSAGDHYLMTSSGHYDVDAPIKEEGKPYRYKPIVVTQDEVEARIREQEITRQYLAEKYLAEENELPCSQQAKPVTRKHVLDGNLEILYRHPSSDSRFLEQNQANFIRNRTPANYKDVVNYFDILSRAKPASRPIKCALCGKLEYSVSGDADEATHCMSCKQVLALGKCS
ncbi:Hypothetical protein GLP15_2731 [Giardia lamblia P15]|uniref:Uncharacterized protein n=1 Tax=Giardia intestinalis (strain P15) TaxID=658858 RepID=E1F8X4_GIAIA|nr:Hypothetical protein GLP15_2731 [Giardia lamblia P15]